jgi:hypothetical protein
MFNSAYGIGARVLIMAITSVFWISESHLTGGLPGKNLPAREVGLGVVSLD